MFPQQHNESDVLPIVAMQSYQTPLQVNRNAFNASHAAAASVYPDANPTMNTSAWRSQAYEFCNDVRLGVQCSILMFNLYDSFTTSVSEYSYQLVNGSCTNTISLSEAAW